MKSICLPGNIGRLGTAFIFVAVDDEMPVLARQMLVLISFNVSFSSLTFFSTTSECCKFEPWTLNYCCQGSSHKIMNLYRTIHDQTSFSLYVNESRAKKRSNGNQPNQMTGTMYENPNPSIFNVETFGDMSPEALDQILVDILVASLDNPQPSDQPYRLPGVVSTME